MTTVSQIGAVEVPKKTGGAGKAVASAFVPGLGQFCDGRNKSGAAYMGGAVACGIGSGVLARSISRDCFKAASSATSTGAFDATKYIKNLPKGKMYAAIALGLVSAGLWIANIVDAYKGNKTKA